MNVRRISEVQTRIEFPNFDSNYKRYLTSFKTTPLGLIYDSIPWSKLVKAFKIKDYSKGPNCIFSPQGKLALLFLKNYSGCSDKKLIEQLNGNIYYQIFCDIYWSLEIRLRTIK